MKENPEQPSSSFVLPRSEIEVTSSATIPMILSGTHTGSDILLILYVIFEEARARNLVAPIHNFLDFITRQI